MITTREGAVWVPSFYGLPKDRYEIKDVIEKPRVIPDLEKLCAKGRAVRYVTKNSIVIFPTLEYQ